MDRLGIIALVVCFVFSHAIFAGKVLTKDFKLEKKQGTFYVSLITIVEGDYQKTVDRLTDFADYDEYGLKYLKEIRVVSDNDDEKVLWTHMQAFAMTAKYYSKVDINELPNRVQATFELISKPKKSTLRVEHFYDHFSGKTIIEKLPNDKEQKERYRLEFTMKLKFDPQMPKLDFVVRMMLRDFANHTVEKLLVF